MCQIIVVSTSSDQDLSEWNTPLVQFSRQLPKGDEHTLLHFEHKWFLGSRDGCSCGFRHLSHGSQELGFSEPVDWWPEEPEDLESTLQAVKLFKRLAISGARLDCIDAWAQDEPKELGLLGDSVVNLAAVPELAFRFFDGHRFEFAYET